VRLQDVSLRDGVPRPEVWLAALQRQRVVCEPSTDLLEFEQKEMANLPGLGEFGGIALLRLAAGSPCARQRAVSDTKDIPLIAHRMEFVDCRKKLTGMHKAAVEAVSKQGARVLAGAGGSLPRRSC
jgi:hypothetical protein